MIRENEAMTERQHGAITVRDGRPDDVSAVMAIDTAVTGLEKADYWNRLFDGAGALAGEKRYFIVAEDGGRVIGFVIGEVRAWEFGSPPCGWIFAISIDPASRQQGIGSLMMEALCDRFGATGVTHVRTMISRDNHLLMSFFRNHGMMAGPYIQLEMELA
jgi:ribosomal protein S18 acetylase RimI-like enzyme